MTKGISYERDQILEIINSVLGKIKAPLGGSDETLTLELADLKKSIEELGKTLRADSIGEISEKHIPAASDELFAVVDATEKATETIMEACESILGTLKDSEALEKVEPHIVAIFEACTFQDITGQRIKKVTECLKSIDEKTESVLRILDGVSEQEEGKKAESDEPVALLNGPGLPGSGIMSQEEIDRLLQEFDEDHS